VVRTIILQADGCGCLVGRRTEIPGLILNFIFAPNLNYREITSLRQIEFFGSLVSVPVGVISQRTRVGEFSSLLLLAFVLEPHHLWRKGITPLAGVP